MKDLLANYVKPWTAGFTNHPELVLFEGCIETKNPTARHSSISREWCTKTHNWALRRILSISC